MSEWIELSDRDLADDAPALALVAPHGDVAALVLQGAVVHAEDSVVQISRADARALADALTEFADGTSA
ncbi:hypothetical protein [Prescottella equi]|uniref:hypothetical protein n=1 Tax=Rhodococcus hoagii TaxID=43767 RepID=UPI000A10187C|nr:hypothetical protein [Prescottella equi]ORM00688.1 hypothetical protein A5N69_07030 [Prescottella equi]ORM21572.1 hypothetical protein A5N74_01670 [Prescottella equi]